MTKVTVDKDLCIGCGACTAIEPSVFEISEDDGLAFVKENKINDDVKMAENSCPTGAINIEEDNDKED